METSSTSTRNLSFPAADHPAADALSIAGAWGYLGGFLVVGMLSVGLTTAATYGFGLKNESGSWMRLVNYLLAYLLFGLYLKTEGMLRPVLCAAGGQRRVPLVLYLLLVLLVPALQVVLDPVVSLLPMPAFVREVFERELLENKAFTFLTVVMAAPVLEELLFRGLLLRGMLQQYSPGRAIVWSSVMFAVFHLMNPWQAIGAFAGGLAVGWLYAKTRSLWLCICFHFINNLFGWTMCNFLFAEVDRFESLYKQINHAATFAALYGAALLVLICGILYLRRLLGQMPGKAEAMGEAR